MSDASIQVGTSHATRLCQTFTIRCEEWAKLIQTDLLSFGIISKLTYYSVYDKRTGRTNNGVSLQTAFYPEFKIFRNRWYYTGRKDVPRDIELNVECIKNWFLGDGCIRDKNFLQLSTESFSMQSNEYLCSILQQQGIDLTINSINRLVTYTSATIKLLMTAIGIVPLCFQYKLKNANKVRDKKEPKTGRICPVCNKEFFNYNKKHKTCSKNCGYIFRRNHE